tara:strand:- start:121 stop:432 length:312 start_codon:yes stop_codon:yes gene_type:complete
MIEKKIVFLDTDDQHARMVTRLRYDRLTQGKFFRGLVELYVQNDVDMAKIIEKIKENKTTMGKRKRKYTLKEIKKGEEMKKDFGLSEDEKNFVFDLIEEDFNE